MEAQYLPPPATAVEAPPTYQLSGWWRRVGASILDGIVIGIPGFAVSMVVVLAVYGSLEGSMGDDELDIVAQIISAVITLPIAIAYYCLMMPRTNGQTVGKMACGIRVVREDGGEMTAGYAFKRQILVIQFLFGYASALLCWIPALLNYLAPLWDDGNRAWHDRIVKSRVVLANPPAAYPGAGQPYPPMQQYRAPAPFPTAPPAAGQQAPAGPPAPPAPPAVPGQPYTPPPPGSVAPPMPPAPPGQQPPPAPPMPPAPPAPGAAPQPYTPPPGFDNPVPDDEQ
jgi:uncharacterized RDD family membrane protein YckC